MEAGKVVTISIILALLLSSVKAEYKQEDDSKDFETAFGGGKASFETDVNEKYCNNKVIPVPVNVSNQEFEKTFAKHFETLVAEGGGTLELEKGVYLISHPVDIPEKCCIRGDSMETTIIRLAERVDPNFPKDPQKGMLSCKRSMHVSVMDLTVDGNKPDQWKGHKYYHFGRYGLSFLQCNYAWIHKVRATRNELYAVFFRGTADKPAYHTYIDQCEADQNDVDGFKLESVQYASIVDSMSRNNTLRCLVCSGNSGKVLIKNLGTESCDRGIEISKEEGKVPVDIRVENTLIINADKAGVYITAGEDIELRNVRVRNNHNPDSPCFDMARMDNVKIDAQCEVISGKRFNTKSGSNNCVDAIVSGRACCPLSCEKCGGSGCEDGCCQSDILASKQSCNDSKLPCVLD